MLAPWKKSYDKPRQCIKKQRHHFANKVSDSQSYDLSSSCEWMWELDHKEGALKNGGFQTVVLKSLESPLDCKEIKPANPKGNQSLISMGRTDAVAEAPILWPPDSMNWLIEKAPDAGKDWRHEKKGETGDAPWINDSMEELIGKLLSRKQGRIEKPGVLQSMGLQRVGQGWMTKQPLNSKYC